MRPVLRHRPSAFAFAAALCLPAFIGCSGPNAIRRDPEAAALDLGQFTIKAAQYESASRRPEKIAETSAYEESRSFRHWQVYFFSGCVSCDTRARNVTHFLEAYRDYCALRGGQWAVNAASASGTCSEPKPFEIRVSVHSAPDRLLQGASHFYLLVDAFERKESGTATIADEFRPESVTRRNNSYDILGVSNPVPIPFWAYGKRDLAAEKSTRELERAERVAAEATRRNERAVRQAAAEVSYLPKTKTIGQQVCRWYRGQESWQTRMGYTHTTIERSFRVTGFTERIEGSRIQIRIGGIELVDPQSGQSKNVPQLGGSPELKAGMIIWDEAIEWAPCQ